MDCQTARLLLALAEADDHAALDAHLGGCAACQGFAAAQAGFDAAVASAMRAVPLPAGGQDRVYTAAAARRASVLRRQWLVGSAVAVAAVLAGPLGYVGFLRTRPTVDTNDLAQAFDARRDNPEGFTAEWLTAQGLPPALPRRLDYRHFLDAGWHDLGDRPTPCVQFVRGTDTLKVFILRRTEFRLAGLQPAQSSFCTVQPVPESADHPGVAYLLLYTTPTLDTFLKPADPVH